MAKKTGEEIVNFDVEIIDEAPQEIPISEFSSKNESFENNRRRPTLSADNLESCLRSEIITVKYAVRPNGNITDPKHELYGGMANNSSRVFMPKMLRNGSLANVLTDSEKNFLEYYMGLEPNALSVHRKKDSYWKDFRVRLTKSDTQLNLAIPEDYIKYKVLLSYTDAICPSLREFTDNRKVTYQFYMVNEGDEVKQNNKAMSIKMESMFELGKIQEDKSILKATLEIMSGRPVSKTSTTDSIQGLLFKQIENNPKLFLQIVKDPLFKTKVFIKECAENGVIMVRSGLYFISSKEPMCEDGQESTLENAAKYINAAKRQELKLTLQAKLKVQKS